MRLGLSACTSAVVLFALACSGEDDSSEGQENTDATTAASGGSSSSNTGNTTGNSGGSGGSGDSGSGDAGGSGGSTSGGTSTSANGGGGSSGGSGGNQGVTTGISPIPGDPGCGLESAAFCDNFDEPSDVRGRAGELDASRWSVSRGQPQLPTSNGLAFSAGAATLPQCRSDLPAQVFPSDDSPICDPTEQVQSNHLLVAVGAQNYGQNSYRIRQPFDFANRTGKIVFDADGYVPQNVGWPSIAVTADPAPFPGYSLGGPGTNNDEGGTSPRRGFLVIFHNCVVDQLGVRLIDVVDNYEDIEYPADACPVMPTELGKLHHFEITVSQSRIEVYASQFSEDGVNFDEPELLHSADVDLPFSRGYVYVTLHNHASLKYSDYDAWFSRFDNVGFDGPVVENWREYEVPDSLIPAESSPVIPGPVMSVGYLVADESMGPRDVLEFQDVDLSGVVSAQMTLGSWYNINEGNLDEFVLKYRFNGGSWRDRYLTEGEIGLLNSGNNHGQLAQVIDVPLEDLVAGTNTLEFVAVNVPQNYPPAISAIDLILTTD